MLSNSQIQKAKPVSITSVAGIFKKFFYSQPVFIKELPAQKFLITIKNEQDIEVSQNQVKKNTEITFQGEVNFYQFFLQTKQDTFIVIGSTFSLYDYISREPYLEKKGEYQFQQKLRKALKLAGGYIYYLPGDVSDFVMDNVNLEDVYSQDLLLRYEHDDKYFYLFVLI